MPGGLQSIEHVFCPINGRFRFAYSANNGEFHCDQQISELSNCPHGNALGVKFRQCNFPSTGKCHTFVFSFAYLSCAGTGYQCLRSFIFSPAMRFVVVNYCYNFGLFSDIHFLCLGDWESHTGDRYLALMDLREEPEARPKYRCGVSRSGRTRGTTSGMRLSSL